MAAAFFRRDDSQAQGFDIRHVRSGSTVRIVVAGELDIATAPRLRDAVELECDDAELVVLDFEHVAFVDSAGLHALIEVHERLNGRLRVILSPPVARLLDLVGVRDRLAVLDSHAQ